MKNDDRSLTSHVQDGSSHSPAPCAMNMARKSSRSLCEYLPGGVSMLPLEWLLMQGAPPS